VNVVLAARLDAILCGRAQAAIFRIILACVPENPAHEKVEIAYRMQLKRGGLRP